MPGYHYSTHSAHLLSAAISRASGASTCEFAYHYLFDPLGITVEHWGQDPQGVSIGGWNLFLTPRELAKIGLLVLHGGQWEDQQIVPADWVVESLSPQMDFGTNYDYGYLWWLREIAGYQVFSSIGPGGQSLHLIPELEMVVVTSGDVMGTAAGSFGFAGQAYLPLVPDVHGGIFFSDKVYHSIRQCIIPALVSDG
jgi:CubicO group peptidase (beta-lactamase class C family)